MPIVYSMNGQDSDDSTDRICRVNAGFACGYEAESEFAEVDGVSEQDVPSERCMVSRADSVKKDRPASKLQKKRRVRARSSSPSLPTLHLPRLGQDPVQKPLEEESDGDCSDTWGEAGSRRQGFSNLLSTRFPGPSRVSQAEGEPNLDDDDCVEDTPARKSVYTTTYVFQSRAAPAPCQSNRAQTFCGVAEPADTWGWAAWQERAASSAWWPLRMLASRDD